MFENVEDIQDVTLGELNEALDVFLADPSKMTTENQYMLLALVHDQVKALGVYFLTDAKINPEYTPEQRLEFASDSALALDAADAIVAAANTGKRPAPAMFIFAGKVMDSALHFLLDNFATQGQGTRVTGQPLTA